MENRNKQDKISNPRKNRIRLPFESRPFDIGVWSYEHRFGLCVTVIIFLLSAIVFMSAKIEVNTIKVVGFIVDLSGVEKERPVIPEKIPAKLTKADFEDVKNTFSNEQAKVSERQNMSSAFTEKLLDEIKSVTEQVSSNKDLYEQGLREEQAIWDAKKPKEEPSESNDTKFEGNVTVSFSFQNPVRSSVNLVVPAYMCEGGGAVVVEVTLNKNGAVISASVDKSQSTENDCMLTTALYATRNSRFNVNSNAPERHRGVVKYIFIPQ